MSEATNNNSDFYSVNEMAVKLNLTANALRIRMCRNPEGLPPFRKVGLKKMGYPKRSYERWIRTTIN